jgi:signal transduction histidine kinase/CheY-like chemotaxis protein
LHQQRRANSLDMTLQATLPSILRLLGRHAILPGTLLLIIHCASATAVAPDKEIGNDSSPDRSPAQEVREFGRPLYRTFTRREEGVVNRLFSAIQDWRGMMLFGSVNCVLEYDGQRWASLKVPNAGWIFGLLSDQPGTIWLGGTNEIGTLVFDGGDYQYKSYTHLLPESERHFGQIISLANHGSDIYFLCERTLLRWDGKRFSEIPLAYEVGNLWSFSSFGGRLFVHAKHQPFSEIVGDHIVPVLNDPVLRETTVIGALELSENKILLVTREKGVFEYSESGVAPFKTDADDLFTKESYVDYAIPISKGRFVIGVQRRGLVFLDAAGHIQETFLEENGLPTGALNDLRRDRAGGLWVVGDTKLTRINPNRSISVFDQENGLPKAYTAATIRFGGYLYAVTGHGLYRLEPGNGAEAPAQFRKVPGLTDWLYRVVPVADRGLLLVGDQGVYLFDGKSFQVILPSPLTFGIARSEKIPDRFFIGGASGLRVLRFDNGRWIDQGIMPGCDRDVTSIVETKEGDLFVETMGGGFFLVKLNQNLEAPFDGARLERLSNVPTHTTNDLCTTSMWGNQVLFGSPKGLFVFRESDRSFYQPDFLPRALIGREIRSVQSGLLKPPHLWLETVIEEGASTQTEEIGRLDSDGNYRALPRAVSSFLGGAKSFYEDSAQKGSTLWIAGEYGVARVDLDRFPQPRPELRLYASEGTTSSGEQLRLPQTSGTLELPFEKRDIRLRFATDDYDEPSEVLYRTKLDGLNSSWTPFYPEATWQSGALNEGQYRLHVIARNSEGDASNEYSLGITISPPWYRTVWMYAGYMVLAGLVVYGLIRWRLWQMRFRERALVSMVDFKTRELRQSEERLRDAKNNAEAANRAKTAFLANMSHEVRTPLNSILGNAQLLLRRNRSADDTASKLNSIIDSGQHLLGMMNELLDLARVESGKLVVNPEAVDMYCFLRTLVAEFEIRARQSSLRFEFEMDDSVPRWIETDPLRLRQILYNLVGNAFKFTSAGSVSLKVTMAGPRLHLQVADTGRGIAAADLPYLFKPFYQALNRDQNTEGVGLGLYITERITRLLGGQIHVSSVLGEGSKFWVDLPVKSALQPTPAATYARVTGYEGPTRKLLVVDDDRSNRDVIRELLAELGFAVEQADSAEAALGIMRSGGFDAVISDIRMTGKDGNAFCREVRSDETLANTVMIASSASVYEGDRHDAESAGFDDFLPKPLKEGDLIQILARHMGLTWILRDESASPTSAMAETIRNAECTQPHPNSEQTLPIEKLQYLLALAGEGDVVALRRTLQELAETEPAHASFVQRLAELVTAYRIDDFEILLQKTVAKHGILSSK